MRVWTQITRAGAAVLSMTLAVLDMKDCTRLRLLISADFYIMQFGRLPRVWGKSCFYHDHFKICFTEKYMLRACYLQLVT